MINEEIEQLPVVDFGGPDWTEVAIKHDPFGDWIFLSKDWPKP